MREIESKVDKVLITKKEFKKISKWVVENIVGKCEGEENPLEKKMFFPLKTFVLEIEGIGKCLVELDDFNPVLGGRVTTDKGWFTWKREHRARGGGFQYDGRGKLTNRMVSEAHKLILDCLMYVCMAERSIEYRPVVERAKKEGYEPWEYTDRVCFLLKDIIRYTGSHQTKKSVKYSCECWGVRGHLRHYDDKTVFIAPYKKGKKRDVLEPKSKTYLVGE